MSKWISYEWSVEYINKFDDVVDVHFDSKLAPVMKAAENFMVDGGELEGEPCRVELALVRRDANNAWDNDHAYIDSDGELSETFDESDKKVPRKYFDELVKAQEPA